MTEGEAKIVWQIGVYSAKQKKLIGEYSAEAANFALWMGANTAPGRPSKEVSKAFVDAEERVIQGMYDSMEALDRMIRELTSTAKEESDG